MIKIMELKGICFIDTSALFKRYITEMGTETLDELFGSKDEIYISSLTVIEVVSNLKRLLEVDKLIDKAAYNAIKGCFLDDIAKTTLKLEAVLPKTLISSIDLIDGKYMTPIDSIQLATALQLAGKSSEFAFVCSDKKLCMAARDKGLNVVEI